MQNTSFGGKCHSTVVSINPNLICIYDVTTCNAFSHLAWLFPENPETPPFLRICVKALAKLFGHSGVFTIFVYIVYCYLDIYYLYFSEYEEGLSVYYLK